MKINDKSRGVYDNEEKYMMPTLIVILVITVIIALWVFSAQRRLVMMDENINNAMSQIGVQLSNRSTHYMLYFLHMVGWR